MGAGDNKKKFAAKQQQPPNIPWSKKRQHPTIGETDQEKIMIERNICYVRLDKCIQRNVLYDA